MKATKLFALLMVCAALSVNVKAQECAAEISVYTEYYKVKNYADAFTPWKHSFDNCPDVTKNLYIHGPRIVEHKLKKASAEEKPALLSLLMKVYDQRLQYYPGKEGYVLGKKGTSLYKYNEENFEEAFKILEKSYELDGNDMSANALTAYFQSCGKMYAAEKIDKNAFFKVYDQVNGIVEANLEGKNAKYYEQAAENVEKLVAPYAECVDLIPLYTSSYEDNKGDTDWLARAARMLDKKECTDADIYFKIAGTLYELQPSSDAAANMGRMSFMRKEYSKAVTYFQEAIEGGKVDRKLSKYYLEMAMAQSKMKQFATAKANALKAASLQSGFGKPYLLLASMYGESAGDCGSNDFERRAVFWAAMDMCAKAKSVDPKLNKMASDLYNSYAKSAPDKTLIFSHGYLDKPEYKVGCWINVTTKVRVP